MAPLPLPVVRLRSKAEHVALLAVAYVPFLVSSPGRVSADSKQYLYLDPGRFLSRAADLWDPTIGAGTVPHQHLGYVVPMGPWFWVFERLGVPDWVAQRLWLGTLAAAALLGARWLFASEEHRAGFEASPGRYAPAYGGYCAFAAADGRLAPIDPEAWSIEGGRLYLNYSMAIRTEWQADRARFIERADARWPELSRSAH